MKRLLAIAITVIVILSMTACSGQKEESEPSPENTAEDVISTVLVDSEKVFEETKDGLISNNGQNIGTDADLREAADDGIKFMASEGENPFMPFAKRLNEFDGINGNNQAFYMKFKPSAKDFGFILSADANAGITIGEENEPVLFVMDHNYTEQLDTDLRIEPGNWYHVLIGMGSDGLMQGTIWKDGEDENAVYMNLHIGSSFGDDRYSNQSWQVNVGFQGEATFTIENYAYYTFSNFVMPDRFIEVDGQNGNEQGYIPQNKDEVLSTMLVNLQELFGESKDQMAENEGGQFGSGVAEKRINDNEGRMELFSGDEGAYMPLNTRLRDFGNDNRPQQAILVKFQPENVSNLKFYFIGMGEFSISFEEDGLYFTDVEAFEKMAFSDTMPNNFDFRWDALYYLLVAFDDQANLRCVVWEENFYQNQAYLEKSLYNGADNIYESNWRMCIGFDGGGQLNIYEYAVYTFDALTEEPPVISAEQNMQNQGNDPGPGRWSVNIGGSFDAMGDGLVGNLEQYQIDVGGDVYTGYRLSDMMNFANAGADTAMVVFGAEGVDGKEVTLPDDAYIVFKKGDEFMGGPFLCYEDSVFEHPVIEVQPN